jgi:glycosyltransferase involved in cell wall biosynthesis
MAMGLPVVAFDLAETRVSAGDAALYARPNEVADFAWQLALLLDHEDWRWRMGAIGRQRIAELFNWERSSKDLLAAYERLFACEQAVQSGLASDP